MPGEVRCGECNCLLGHTPDDAYLPLTLCRVCGPHVGCREGKPCARCKELAAQIRAAVERRNAA